MAPGLRHPRRGREGSSVLRALQNGAIEQEEIVNGPVLGIRRRWASHGVWQAMAAMPERGRWICSGLMHRAGVTWCILRFEDQHMPRPPTGTSTLKSASPLRASVTFPPDLYRTLEQIAKEKKVSLAWVVRDAAERYVADQQPMPRQRKGTGANRHRAPSANVQP